MRWRARFGTAALIWAVVLVSSLLGILSRMPGTLAVFWLSNALLLGLLLRNRQMAGPLTWLAAATGYLAADLVTGADWRTAALLNSANIVGVLAGYYTFRYCPRMDVSLSRTRSVAWLALLATTASGAAALVGGVAEVVMFDGTWATGALGWFGIEIFNYAVILPLVLTFPARRSADVVRAHWRRLASPVGLFAVAMIPSWYLGGLGALVATTPALIAAALLADVFITALFIGASTTWALVLTVGGRVDVLNPDGIPLTPSMMIGLALLAAGPLAIACTMAERERVSAALRLAMTRDDLTRAYRRREFVARADAALAAAAAVGIPTALLMMDLDHFKRLNDNCGHQAGDRALTAFADVVRACIRDGDLFARLGGEEFALLMPGVDCGAAAALAEDIRSSQQDSATAELGDWGPTVSIGLSCSSTSQASLGHLLAEADAALYRAKTTGRNRVAPADVRPAAARRSPMPAAWPSDTRAS